MPKVAPISVCLIVRNEGKTLEQCLESIRPHVEEIVVVDTGSTDNTPEIAQKYADVFEVYTGCNDANGLIASFSNARNRSFDLATKEWIMWVDGDDVVSGADKLADLVRSYDVLREGRPTAVMMPYEYSHDAAGKCTCFLYRERLVTPRSHFKWVHPVHEVLATIDAKQPVDFYCDDVRMIHKRNELNKALDPQRNLRILQNYKIESEDERHRYLFYIAQEYANNNMVSEAIDALEHYVPISVWSDEKCVACLRLSDLYRRIGKYKDAERWAREGIKTKPDWGEPYMEVAKAYYFMASEEPEKSRAHHANCVEFARTGLSKPKTKTAMIMNPDEREFVIHRFLNFSLNYLGDVQGALDSVNQALAHKPGDPEFLHNKKVYEQHLVRVASGSSEKIEEISMSSSGQTQKEYSDSVWKPYIRPPNYPSGVTRESFPVALKTPHPQAWGIPEQTVIDDLPLVMSDDQLQSLVTAVWKEYMLHDEVLSAKAFLERAPFRVRYTDATLRMLRDTDATMKWIDTEDSYDAGNTPTTPDNKPFESEMVPLDRPLLGQVGQRFQWISDRLKPRSKLVDMGCIDGEMSNRWGMAGHFVTGLDICTNSVRIANESASRNNTGARHVRTYFKDAPDKLNGEKFDVVTCADTYEHLKDPVEELLVPARKLVKEDGKMLLVTPAGAWYRGQYCDFAHPWIWSNEGDAWNAPRPRAHLFAPTVWEATDHFRAAGWWVHSCTVVEQPSPDVPGQGNVCVEAYANPPTRNGKKVVFFLGPAWETWNPHTIDRQGMGGSETAAVQMCKRLVQQGFDVHVYSPCGLSGEGVYDGVEYRDISKFHDIETDVLVVSRYANASTFPNIKATVKYLWTHDVVPMNITHENYLKFDKVLALSNWHKNNIVREVPYIHPDSVVVTRNGIDPNRFTARPARNPRKIVYSSSPDRGLVALLESWEKIKSRVPDAELHVFYGFKNWKLSASMKNDPAEMKFIEGIERKLSDLRRSGVFFRDRVNQQDLALEFLSAGVWAYPTWFTETSCITAMEAQAAGLNIVTSPVAALVETVGDRGVMVSGDWSSEDYRNRFVDAVVDACHSDRDREWTMAAASKMFDWSGVAESWRNMFLTDLQKDIPEIAYRSPYAQ